MKNIMGRKKIYTEEELKERRRVQHKEAVERYRTSEHGRKMTRAKSLISNYKKEDELYNREIPDFDSKWVVENIFNQKCVYCGESDWTKLGCDRVDNSIGHIKSNVVCSCLHCNMIKPKEDRWKKKYGEKKKKRVDQIDSKSGIVIQQWDSAKDCEEYGYNGSCIRQCCVGAKKTHKGFYWKRPTT